MQVISKEIYNQISKKDRRRIASMELRLLEPGERVRIEKGSWGRKPLCLDEQLIKELRKRKISYRVIAKRLNCHSHTVQKTAKKLGV